MEKKARATWKQR